MTGGYNSEERPKPLNGNFKNDKGFHHNTMGKNATIDAHTKSVESPKNNLGTEGGRNSNLDNQGSNSSIVKLPGHINNSKQTLSPVPSLPNIAQQRNSPSRLQN